MHIIFAQTVTFEMLIFVCCKKFYEINNCVVNLIKRKTIIYIEKILLGIHIFRTFAGNKYLEYSMTNN